MEQIVSDYGVILCTKMSTLKNSRLTGVLLDISGVLKDGGTAIAGSVEAVRKLREAGFKIRLVTNETQITRQTLAASLTDIGFCVQERDIIPPCPALITLLKRENMRPHLLVHPNVLPEFDGIDQNNPNCVVVSDAADNFTYENLNEAFRILIEMEKPRLFTLGRGRYYSDNGVLVLDVGVFTAALEYAADTQAEVIGKPQPEFFMSALRDMGVEPQEAVMVGDDIVSDVGGAQHCGLTGMLVRTGKYRPSDEKHPTVHPDAIVNDLAQAVDLILKYRQ
jgi:phospholysine phosphohistidine inorganic pyrophosphate phosphatase